MAPSDVPDDEPLTHYGHESYDPPFRNATRSYETEVSLICGQRSAREAASLIRHRGSATKSPIAGPAYL